MHPFEDFRLQSSSNNVSDSRRPSFAETLSLLLLPQPPPPSFFFSLLQISRQPTSWKGLESPDCVHR